MPDGTQNLADWITAVATACTAVAAGAAGIIAWIALRRDSRAPLPILEPKFTWGSSSEFLDLQIGIRNHFVESITIDSVTVKCPRGMTICSQEYNNEGRMVAVKTNAQSMQLGWKIGAPGDYGSIYLGLGPSRRDVEHQTVYFVPPSEWNGGKVVLEFRVSSMALTIRDKRMTIIRHVPVAPRTQTDANAKSAA